MNVFGSYIPVVLGLFILMEVCLLVYQSVLFVRRPYQRKFWWVGLLLILLLLANMLCRFIGNKILIILNAAFLLMAAMFWLQARALRRELTAILQEQRTQVFIENCRKYDLSKREIEIILLIRKGLKYRDIGEQLFISEKTVDSHMQNIYTKVGERSKLALLNKLDR